MTGPRRTHIRSDTGRRWWTVASACVVEVMAWTVSSTALISQNGVGAVHLPLNQTGTEVQMLSVTVAPPSECGAGLPQTLRGLLVPPNGLTEAPTGRPPPRSPTLRPVPKV